MDNFGIGSVNYCAYADADADADAVPPSYSLRLTSFWQRRVCRSSEVETKGTPFRRNRADPRGQRQPRTGEGIGLALEASAHTGEHKLAAVQRYWPPRLSCVIVGGRPRVSKGPQRRGLYRDD